MNEYQRRVLAGRKEFLKLVQRQEKELLKIYEEASRDVTERLARAKPGGITARYLSELDKSIDRYLLELRINLSKSIKDSIEASSQIASAVQLSYFDMIAPREDIRSTFNKMFTQLPSSIVKQLINGNYYKDGKTLDRRVWELTSNNSKAIDSLIKVNASKGANARELAKQLNAYINPKNKLKSVPIYIPDGKGKLIKAPLPDGISYNVSYQARRLSRTCLTHASTETYIQGSKMNPFCKGLKWNLSPSHSSRMHGKTDICDTYAGKIFKLDEVPIQHPNCLCYFTQEVMDIDKARDELIDWINGEDNPKLDKWLEDYGEEFGIERNLPKTFSELDISKDNTLEAVNKKGKNIQFDISNMKHKDEVVSNLTTLSNEYNTNLEKVINKSSGKGIRGSVDYTGTIMELSTSDIKTVYHEFSHTLSNSRWDKDAYTQSDNEFWKNIKRIRSNYNKEKKKLDSLSLKGEISDYNERFEKIFISPYAEEKKIDEFMAECFTRAKLDGIVDFTKTEYSNECSPYAIKVLQVVDKYFKK